MDNVYLQEYLIHWHLFPLPQTIQILLHNQEGQTGERRQTIHSTAKIQHHLRYFACRFEHHCICCESNFTNDKSTLELGRKAMDGPIRLCKHDFLQYYRCIHIVWYHNLFLPDWKK